MPRRMRKPRLQVQYTTEGTIWHNANIISAGTSAYLRHQHHHHQQTCRRHLFILTNNGTAAWDNQVIVDLTGVSGVDNDPNFAVRIVNASTGTNCLDTTGAHYNNATPPPTGLSTTLSSKAFPLTPSPIGRSTMIQNLPNPSIIRLPQSQTTPPTPPSLDLICQPTCLRTAAWAAPMMETLLPPRRPALPPTLSMLGVSAVRIPATAGTVRRTSAHKAPNLMSARSITATSSLPSTFILRARVRQKCACFTPQTAGRTTNVANSLAYGGESHVYCHQRSCGHQ